jgi:GDP-4-dehydro-6-deoxy-D-mannose reductase
VRALVVGADGFAGRWLLRHLRDVGDHVTAIVGPRFTPPLDGAENVLPVDVRDASGMANVFRATQPEAVLYLAGVTTRIDRDAADAALGVSVIGSLHALIASSALSPAPRLLFVSTCYVYGPSPGALSEDSVVEPPTVYAAAKLAAERALLTLGPALNVEVVVARPFNHTGPGQADSFLVPTLAKQISAAAARGVSADVRVEDASIVRDFTDVRDVVAAYRLLAERGESGAIYNVASGTGLSVEDLAHEIASVAGITARLQLIDHPPPVHEPPTMIGDAGRLEALGWRREYSLQSTLRDIMSSLEVEATSAG